MGYDPNAPRQGMGWSNEVVAAALPKRDTNTKTTVLWATTETMKHVGFIAADTELNLVVPLRDPRTRTMSYYLWRKWRYPTTSSARPDTGTLLEYYEKGVKKLNNMLERFVSKQHKAGALFYLHSTMLQDQDLVLKQFADMLNLRRLVDSEQEYVDLIAKIKTRLPEALEIPEAAESSGANVTTSGRVHRRLAGRRHLVAAGSGGESNGAPSAHSRLGKVRNEDAKEEAKSLCEWAGKATVRKMDKVLYGDGSMTYKYAAALFPMPASVHCEEDGSELDAAKNTKGGVPRLIGRFAQDSRGRVPAAAAGVSTEGGSAKESATGTDGGVKWRWAWYAAMAVAMSAAVVGVPLYVKRRGSQ